MKTADTINNVLMHQHIIIYIKCSNEESVIGTQCRLNCWKGKYGVHNTTVECKGDKWKVICLIMIFNGE